jgi:hypothetical protein
VEAGNGRSEEGFVLGSLGGFDCGNIYGGETVG